MNKNRVLGWFKNLGLSVFLLSVSGLAYGDFRDELIDAFTNFDGDKVFSILSELSVEKYKDPKHLNFFGNVFRWATTNGHKNTVELLLARGIDPNIKDRHSEKTALHLAVEGENLELVTLLLNHQADPNISDIDQQTPLHPAALLGNAEILELLLSKGGEPNRKDKDNQTPFHCALRTIDSPSLMERFLLKGGDLDQADGQGNTPLLLAVAHGNQQVVQFLWSKNVNPTAKNNQGRTALHLATSRGYLETVRYLLTHSLDPNATDHRGNTPLHYAANYGHDKVAELLLSQNANPNIADLKGRTALHFAADHADLKIVKHLLSHHADVNLRDGEGLDAFDHATARGDLKYGEIVRILHEKMVAGGWEALKASENFAEFKKRKESIFTKTAQCSAYLENNKEKETIHQFLEILKNVGKNLMIKEFSDQVYPHLSLEACDRGEGLCESCLEEGKRFACPASNLNCSNAKCATCSRAEAEQLLVNNKMACARCNEKVKPQMYAHIPGGDRVGFQFKERMYRTELMKDPNWKFCPREECLYGVSVKKDSAEKESSQYLECPVCDFKGCLECGKDHRGTCEVHLADRQAMIDLLNKGEKVEMRKLMGSEPDENHPLYLEASDPRLEHPSMKSKYGSIQNENDPHFYDGKYRPCPHCGVITERADGCNSMLCRSCGKEYHWNHGKTNPVAHDYQFETKQYQLAPGIEPHY